jgi:hypothetical protein
LASSPDLAATGVGVGAGSSGFVSTAARADSELPSTESGLGDGAAADPGFVAVSSVIASRAASPVLFCPADLPELSTDAVLFRSMPVFSPPRPDRHAAIKTAAMCVACYYSLAALR